MKLIPNTPFFNKTPDHQLLRKMLNEALKAADPRKSVAEALRVEKDAVIVGGKPYPTTRVHVLGFGKASIEMAKGVLDALGSLVEDGIVIAPEPAEEKHVGPIKVLEATHPIPTEKTVKASQELLSYAENLPRNSLAIVLVSGGGSALFEVPADNISINEIAWVTRELLKRGATIEELNAVRKHLSRVKGGQLLKHIASNNVATLIVSDVIGDRLDTIASGPTVPDQTTYHDAKKVLEKYGLWSQAPKTIRDWIEKGLKGEAPETPKPGDPIFKKNHVLIVANNMKALKAAEKAAKKAGYNTIILTDRLRGEAREVAKTLAAIAETIHHHNTPIPRPAAILAGGETTVTVKGNGIGGRNQELCLALLKELKDTINYIAACMGTDGIDGVSPAAGATIDPETWRKTQTMKLDPEKHLENNDSYTFFKKLETTIETGYTGTNVNDITIILLPKH